MATYAAGAQNDVLFLAGNNLDESGAVPETAFDYWREAGYPDRPGPRRSTSRWRTM